jgi:hypothetical protein
MGRSVLRLKQTRTGPPGSEKLDIAAAVYADFAREDAVELKLFFLGNVAAVPAAAGFMELPASGWLFLTQVTLGGSKFNMVMLPHDGASNLGNYGTWAWSAKPVETKAQTSFAPKNNLHHTLHRSSFCCTAMYQQIVWTDSTQCVAVICTVVWQIRSWVNPHG